MTSITPHKSREERLENALRLFVAIAKCLLKAAPSDPAQMTPLGRLLFAAVSQASEALRFDDEAAPSNANRCHVACLSGSCQRIAGHAGTHQAACGCLFHGELGEETVFEYRCAKHRDDMRREP